MILVSVYLIVRSKEHSGEISNYFEIVAARVLFWKQREEILAHYCGGLKSNVIEIDPLAEGQAPLIFTSIDILTQLIHLMVYGWFMFYSKKYGTIL